MRNKARQAIVLGLSIVMAFGMVPTQALAEALEEVASSEGIVQSGEPDLSVVVEVPSTQQSEDSGDGEGDGFVETVFEELDFQSDDVQTDRAQPIESQTDDDDEGSTEEMIIEQDSTQTDDQEDETALATSADASIRESGMWGTCAWDVSVDGTLTVHAGEGANTGGRSPWNEYADRWTSYGTCINYVVFEEGVKLPQDCSDMFDFSYGWSNRINLRVDLSKADASAVTDVSDMFCNVSALTSVDLSGWDTAHIKNMKYMFACATSLESIEGMANWDTSNVTSFESVFDECHELTSLDLSGWDTSNARTLTNMFYNCKSLTSLDLTGWNTSNVETDNGMFHGCLALEYFKVGSGYRIASSNMFCCSAASNGKWLSNADGIWYTKTQIVASRSQIADTYTFEGEGRDPNPNIIDEGVWGTCPWAISADGTLTVRAGKGKSMRKSPWEDFRSMVKKAVFEDGVVMPEDCNALFTEFGELVSVDASGCDVSKMTNQTPSNLPQGMFRDCPKLVSVDTTGWKTSNWQRLDDTFNGCSALTEVKGIEDWDTSNAVDLEGLFQDCRSLKSLDLHKWVTDKVTCTTGMFWCCTSLASLDVSGWDLSLDEEATFMFSTCNSLDSLDLSDWADKVGSLYRAEGMFDNCINLKSLNLHGWNVANLEDAGWMFSGNTSLQTLDVSGWQTPRLTDAYNMFQSCSALESLDLSSWDTTHVTSVGGMFSGCSPATVKVGNTYVMSSSAMFPCEDYECAWRSAKTKELYTAQQITSSRSGVADTYTQERIVEPVSIVGATVSGIAAQTYSGKAIKPKPVVSLGGTTLVLGTDYTLSYGNNVNAGNATVVVTGKGDYTGVVRSSFTIAPRAITSIDDIADVAWTGSDVAPKLTVRAGDLVLAQGDYGVAYEGDHSKIGTVTAVVTATGNFKGTLRKAFNIVRMVDDPAAEDSVYNELKAAYDEAKAAADAAATTFAGKEAAYQSALETLQAVRNEVGEEYDQLKATADTAKAALDAAKKDRDEKQSALNAAQSAVTANSNAIVNAETDLATKQTTAGQKQQAVTSAQSAVTDAQSAYDAATADVAAAQAAIDAEVPDPKSNANHKEWTAYGFFKYIRDNAAPNSAEYWDAQCALDILDGGSNTTGHSYAKHQGPQPDGVGASSWTNIAGKIAWAQRGDAVGLDNVKMSLKFLAQFNSIRAEENAAEGTSLRTDIGTNCRQMAISIVQCDASKQYSVGHTQAYDGLENLSWSSSRGKPFSRNSYTDPYYGWYDEEKVNYKTGNGGVTGHYTTIVDLNSGYYCNVAGFAVCNYGASYGECRELSTFGSFFDYPSYMPMPAKTYSIADYESLFDTYYQQQVDAGMFGTTEAVKAQHQTALTNAKATQAKKKTALSSAKSALTQARSALQAANDDVAAAQATLDGLRDQAAGLEAARDSAQSKLNKAKQTVSAKQTAYNNAKSALDSFDGTARIAAAQRTVDAAKAARDDAQGAKDAADATLADAAEALGIARKLTKDNTTVEGITEATYDGTAHMQNGAKLYVTMTRDGRSETYELKKGTDYAVSYASNKNAGTAKVTFTGKGDFVGSVTKEFAIARASVTSIDAIAYQSFTSSAITPELVVRADGLTLGKADYTASFSNNTNAGIASVTVTGKGNFTGTASQTFTIVKAAQAISVTATKVTKTYGSATFSLGAKRTKGNGKLTYATNNAKVATVDTTGKVAIKGVGTATIIVTAAATTNYKKATKSVTVTVIKGTQTISAANKSVAMGKTASLGAKRAKGNGKLTYVSSNTKIAKVSASGVVTPVKVGSCKITITAAATTNWKKATKTITVTVVKGAQPMVASAVRRTASAKTLKSKSVTVARPISITKYQGKLTYAKVTSGSSAALTVNKTTGKVTVKKGTKAGTYTIKIKVSASGNTNWKAGSKTVTCRITVK